MKNTVIVGQSVSPNKSMIKYQKAIFVTALIISIPSLFLLFVGIVKMSITHIGFWAGMLALWWGLYYCLRKGSKRAFWLSFGLSNLFWCLLLWQTGRRFVFVIEQGGMEKADGQGSPVAFLIGMTGEQVFFLPLCFVMFFGIMVIKSFNKSRHSTQQQRG